MFKNLILETAMEGIVLLKNEENNLPFSRKDTVSIFGRCQYDFYKNGMGSGGSVHAVYSTYLKDELEKLIPINKKVSEKYREWIEKNPFDNQGGLWAAEPYCQKEMPLDEKFCSDAAKKSNKALYIIGRTAGEDKDFIKEEGSWYLNETEKNTIKTICKYFDSVTIGFNTCSIIDTKWIEEEELKSKIKSVIYLWQGGQESGRAAAKILAGEKSPCGKLTDTIAYSIEDYPSTKCFGNPKENFYEEDIYVGYRFFETFAKEKIQFPFGYGLSYTTFSKEILESKQTGKDISTKVKIINTGKYSGKEIIQLYICPPQGILGKEAKSLCAFKKTSELKPGEEEILELKFNLEYFSSYDETGKTGYKSSFVLESGKYYIEIGNDSLNTEKLIFNDKDYIEINNTICVQKLQQAAAPEKPFKRIKPEYDESRQSYKIIYEDVPLNEVNMEKRISENLPQEIPYMGALGINFDNLKKDPELINSFISQLKPEELATMVRGEGMMSQKVTVGIAAAFGGVSEALHNYKIPVSSCADGPSGIRLDTGREASLMPIGTQLACTWNEDLIEKLFEEEGKELFEYEIDSLLGPGINIHRNPLNGRNFEYLSEDPLLTGKIAAAQLRGMEKSNTYGTIKHFAANSQEKARSDADSICSERALREIYLKAFYIAIKEGNAKSLMTSYNPINGHWAASNYDLVNTILRKEWNYSGLVMTDWWAKMNHCAKGGEESIKNTAYMIRARNDVYMVVDNDGAETNVYNDNILSSLKNGELTLGELQLCVKDIIKFILATNTAKRPLRKLKEIKEFTAEILTEEEAKKSGLPLADENSQMDFSKNDTYIFYAHHDAEWTIRAEYAKTIDDLSQSVSGIMIDGIMSASVESRSTQGKWIWVNAAQVSMKKGFYKIKIETKKPGIKVRTVTIDSKICTPVSLGVYK